jgi:hypothetical protein
MANLGRTITSVYTLNNFTAKVVYAASDRYGTTQFNQTFQVGYEYTGPNFFKGSNRPPKLRILSAFQPLLNGNPNASNDTYVAFQVYDYTLGVWRGPWCKRANQNDAWTYVDYFLTTIDSFGRKYGNYYTGTGSSFTTFSAPTALFSQNASLSLTTLGGRSITAIAGHNPNIFTMGGSTNKMYHFHGFLTLAGYNGTWCFYSISANGVATGFNHLLDAAPYNTGTYPNVLPYTSKLTSEWRIATFCNISSLGYSPRIRIASTGLGPIKAYFGQDPGTMFPNGVDNINIFEAEVWCTYDPGSAANFFLTPLWRPGGSTEESEQGVEGTQAAEYAPAGWYGTSLENSYAYWDGLGSWTPGSYATYQVAPTSTEFTYYGFYQTQDPMEVCSTGPQGAPMTGYYDTSAGFNMMTQLFLDSALQNPIMSFVPNRFYYNQTDGVTFSSDPSARVQVTFKC